MIFFTGYLFFPQGFRESGNNLLCSVTHLLQSLILHRPITGACMFVIYDSSEGGESLFMLCCQGDNKFVFIMLG